VTLRRDVMYEFFDRFGCDGVAANPGFPGHIIALVDGRGNYSLGIADQTIFPRSNWTKIKRQQGMDITIVTTAPTDEEALDFLKMMGMPFAEGR